MKIKEISSALTGKFAHLLGARYFELHFFGAFWWLKNLESKPDARLEVRIDDHPVR